MLDRTAVGKEAEVALAELLSRLFGPHGLTVSRVRSEVRGRLVAGLEVVVVAESDDGEAVARVSYRDNAERREADAAARAAGKVTRIE